MVALLKTLLPTLSISFLLLSSGCMKRITVAEAFPPVDNSKLYTQQGDDFDGYLTQHYAKMIGTAAPDISFEALTTAAKGNTKNLKDFQGKIVILNFWFAQCVPCITEIPSLKEIVKDYNDKDVELISITIDNLEKTKELIAKYNISTYLVAANGKANAQTYDIKSYPTTFLINKQGIIERVFFGASDWDGTYTYKEITPHLKELLDK